jgi:RNA 3'-terminal phosphate cyclase (ATP)
LLLEIDGSQKSGSGTILRLAVALAAIKGQPLHLFNIRQNRPKKGLQPQHLEAVLTAAKLCNAQTKGITLGSSEIWFTPHEICGGRIEAEIGTAGNIPMLIMTVLPICLFAKEPVKLRVTKGGTDTSHAPTISYLEHVFLETLKQMGVEVNLTVQRYGYYPKGNGEATLVVKPTSKLTPFRKENFGSIQNIQGISICTFLADRKVAERQAHAATKTLKQKGYNANIQVVNDTSNTIQKGSSIAIWAKTDRGAIIGSDAIGELKKMAEAVGTEAAENLTTELQVRATVDNHLADMLIPYCALTQDPSVYLTRKVSGHLESNIWLAEHMLGAKFKIESAGTLFKVEKLAEN